MKMLKQQLLTLIALVLISLQGNVAAADKKIVMVVSSHGQEQGKIAPGYEFDELARAYLVFKSNGIAVDIASPKGGVVEADRYDPTKPYNAKILADDLAMAKLSNTIATDKLDASAYDGVFIVGGKGAMFDLPKDPALKSVIAAIYQQEGSVAAVCHGPAALVDVKLNDGSYLVAGKAINSFTNSEEKLFGQKWINHFDFLLQDKLIERGAKFQSSDIMLSHVAVDGRLITGQNPMSTVGVANALVKQLGLTPIMQAKDKETATLATVAEFLAGDKGALKVMADNQTQYSLKLVAMYGFYYLKTATKDDQFKHALNLMRAGQAAMNKPMLDMAIAKIQHQLGRIKAARVTLNQLLAAKPDHQAAKDMLQTL